MKRKNTKTIILHLLVLLPGHLLFAAPIEYRLTGEDAKRIAEINSTELKIIKMQLNTVKKSFSLSLRNYFPQLNISFYNNDSVVYGMPDSSSKQLSLTLIQPLFDGGRSSIARRLSETQLLFKNKRYNQTRENVLDTAWSFYFKTLILQKKAALQTEILEIAKNQHTIIKKEKELGSARDIDLIETEIEVSSMEIEAQITLTELEESFFRLKNALEIEQTSILVLTEDINTENPGIKTLPSSDFIYSGALANNLEIKEKEFNIFKKIEELKTARKSIIPNIRAEVTASISGNRYPLQQAGGSVKLLFSFPSELFPFSTELSAGFSGSTEVSRGSSANTGILQAVGTSMNEKQGILNLERERYTKNQFLKSLKFKIDQLIKSYNMQKETLELKNKN